MATTFQFKSVSCTYNNGSSRRNRHSVRSTSISATRKKSVGHDTSSYQFNTGVWEIKGKAVHDTEENVEVASEPQMEKVDSGVTKKDDNSTKKMDVLVPCVIKQNKVEKQAKQEEMTNSLIVISRILKGMPQSPHFYPLRNHSELARKWLISSWDRIFEETVEQIQSLQVDDFWVKAKELWKTMEDLQNMGYNVIPLRKRLVKLTDVMREQKKSELEVKEMKIKAENHRLEKSKVEFVVLNLQKTINKGHECMERLLHKVTEMEKELPTFDSLFAKLAMESLSS